jgi:hypothetical protein
MGSFNLNTSSRPVLATYNVLLAFLALRLYISWLLQNHILSLYQMTDLWKFCMARYALCPFGRIFRGNVIVFLVIFFLKL